MGERWTSERAEKHNFEYINQLMNECIADNDDDGNKIGTYGLRASRIYCYLRRIVITSWEMNFKCWFADKRTRSQCFWRWKLTDNFSWSHRTRYQCHGAAMMAVYGWMNLKRREYSTKWWLVDSIEERIEYEKNAISRIEPSWGTAASRLEGEINFHMNRARKWLMIVMSWNFSTIVFVSSPHNCVRRTRRATIDTFHGVVPYGGKYIYLKWTVQPMECGDVNGLHDGRNMSGKIEKKKW